MITFPHETVDLFAGPGGWDLAARKLGLRVMGIESDHSARLTRRAAGFETVAEGSSLGKGGMVTEADVRKWGPANFPNARGLIASPPCQTFSAAGKGAGRRALDVVLYGVAVMQENHRQGLLSYAIQEWEDERTGLVLEPLRWALDAILLGRPYQWLAFEQVPTVLPVWQAMADVLRSEGYSVAVGNLQAEQYGVPQTRKRAVLVARHHSSSAALREIQAGRGAVELPTPTHSKYHTRDKTRLDPGVLPWVSMVQALGWDGSVVSAQSVAGVGRAVRDAADPGFTVTETTSRVMRSNYGTGGDPAARGERSQDEPAPTVTGKIDRNKWQIATGTRPNAATRMTDEPSPAFAFGHDSASFVWTPAGATPADVIEHKAAQTSVRVSVEEAGVLQSFPADFPWRGSRTKQYQQVGNAIPPLLAEAVLRQVV